MKHTKNFNNWNKINEEGDGGGGTSGGGTSGGGTTGGGTTGGGTTGGGTTGGGTTGGDSAMGAGATVGSGDGGSGVAYFNQGNVDGMGSVKNAKVSPTPGDSDESVAGSGDSSVYLPAFTFTKNTGITGNRYNKRGKTTVNLGKINKIKDELGVGKTMKFKEFINK